MCAPISRPVNTVDEGKLLEAILRLGQNHLPSRRVLVVIEVDLAWLFHEHHCVLEEALELDGLFIEGDA